MELFARHFLFLGVECERFFKPVLGIDQVKDFLAETVLEGFCANAVLHCVSTKTLQDSFRKEIFDLIDSKDRFEKALTFHSKEKEMSRKKLHIVLTTNPPVVMLQISEMLDKLRRIEMVPEHERENFIEEITDVYAP